MLSIFLLFAFPFSNKSHLPAAFEYVSIIRVLVKTPLSMVNTILFVFIIYYEDETFISGQKVRKKFIYVKKKNISMFSLRIRLQMYENESLNAYIL